MFQRGGRAAAAGLALAILVTAIVSIQVRDVRAASPTPGIVSGGDTRSEGEGAGFVGSPLFVALAVVAIGAGTALATIVVVRLTRDES
jgi:hypothetical protein